MKLIHLSDLHLGLRLNGFSMLEDQAYILFKTIRIIDEEKPDAILIAGDIYDKPVPSTEAVQLFDDFLVRLSTRKLKIFIISGNHDSPERIAFGSQLMNLSGVYVAPVYGGNIQPVTLHDEHGDIDLYMLPFVKPSHVKRYFPDSEIETHTDAIKVTIDNMEVDTKKRNILIAHQFVTGALRCESEYIHMGGADNVDSNVFAPFDYVALGHLHGPQNVGKETIRYCGTLLKYSFSEVEHEKSITVIDMHEKGNIKCRYIPIEPKTNMRKIKGSYLEVTARENYKDTNTNDYIQITLTDEEDIPYVIEKLRAIYKNIMKIDYDNKRTRDNATISLDRNVEQKSPLQFFEEFYGKQNNQCMTEEQRSLMAELIEEIWGSVCNETY